MPLHLYEPAVLPPGQVDLGLVAGHHRLAVHAQPGQEHLHLRAGGVLRLVQDDERVGQGASSHVRQRRDLDRAGLERALNPIVRHHVFQRVVQRAQVGIDLGLEIAREKAERLASLHRGAREDDALDPLPGQRLHRLGDGEIGLAGAGRPDADHDVVVADRLEIVALALGLRHDRAAQPRQHDLPVARRRGELGRRSLRGQAVDVVGRHRLAHPREVEQSLDDRTGALELLGRPAQADGVAPERHPDAQRPLQLEQVGIVDTREQQRVGAFRRDALVVVVGHHSSASWR